jgi:hypothetical protein
MATLATTATVTTASRRIAAAALVAVALLAIVIHGKTSRGPKPVIAETAETIRFTDRPQIH